MECKSLAELKLNAAQISTLVELLDRLERGEIYLDISSFRPEGFAKRHSLSLSFIYNEIKLGRLRARKASTGVTLITAKDERDWLEAMPLLGEAENDNLNRAPEPI
jgi:hypothetical protein